MRLRDFIALAAILSLIPAMGCAPPPEPVPAPTPTPAPVAAPTPADTVEAPREEPPGAVDPVAPLRVEASWTNHAPLPERRTEVSVATDGNRIFLAGGFGPPEGEERARAPRTLWAYDPDADNWVSLGPIPEGVHHAAFAHVGGRLYILGGFRETTFEPVGNVRIFDLQTNQWSEGAPMPTPRGAAGFTVHEGRIHVIGGNAAGPDQVHDHEGVLITEDRSVNVHEVYDPATNSWATLTPMPTARNHLGAATLLGRIHAVVGRADGHFTMTTHEIYDPGTNSWRSGPPVPTGRSGVAVVTHGEHLYLFGGEDLAEGSRRTFANAERFNSRTNRWELLPNMPTARHGLGAASYGPWVYVISGGPQPAFSFGDANERLELAR